MVETKLKNFLLRKRGESLQDLANMREKEFDMESKRRAMIKSEIKDRSIENDFNQLSRQSMFKNLKGKR